MALPQSKQLPQSRQMRSFIGLMALKIQEIHVPGLKTAKKARKRKERKINN